MTTSIKKKIVKNGKLFTMNPYELENITDKDYLLITIIKEWLKICDEAVDDAHKGTGIMLMITGITNYSQSCRDAYPFLYQAILAY